MRHHALVRPLVSAAALTALGLAALGAAPARAQVPSFAPAGWTDGVKLPEVPDTNPDPNIVEVTLTAKIAEVEVSPGKKVKAWTYNGVLPGPLIKGKVGDRLIVHLKNELDQPTTIHWHGLRVPIEMDGVPDVTQPAVKTGETFTYDFILRDASLYWYHPHYESAAQVGYGLYGPLLVEDPNDPVGVPDTVTIVLSDIGFDSTGTLEPADSGGSAGMVFGREGAYVLVNGRTRPTLKARSGAPQRWRIVNTAKSRFFYLDLDGQEFTVIGEDGGLQESPTKTGILLVTVGERKDVIVRPTGKPGSELTLRAMLYNRGYGSIEYRSVEDIMTVALSPEPTVTDVTLPEIHRTLVPPPSAGATPVPMVFTLPPQEAGKSEFRINGVPYWKAKPFLAKLGETQLWTVQNDTDWDHPFHLHGYFFMVVDEKGEPLRPMVWKDTVNIPMKTTARILVTFDERPGTWMIHCHILDHAEGGLMGTVQVGDKATEHVHAPPKP
ncbi:MAG: multicopper oxidase family protein [Vicinamibacterales bacterium]